MGKGGGIIAGVCAHTGPVATVGALFDFVARDRTALVAGWGRPF